jgi:hypothetical protein
VVTLPCSSPSLPSLRSVGGPRSKHAIVRDLARERVLPVSLVRSDTCTVARDPTNMARAKTFAATVLLVKPGSPWHAARWRPRAQDMTETRPLGLLPDAVSLCGHPPARTHHNISRFRALTHTHAQADHRTDRPARLTAPLASAQD